MTGLKTLCYKEIKRVFRIWKQTLVPPLITSILYFVVFGKFLAERIGTVEGFPYISFILPGLIMLSVITSAYSNTSSSFFAAKLQRSIEEILASPMKNYTVIIGYTVGGAVRGIIVGILVYVVALIFADFILYNIFIVALFILLSAILFSLAGFLNGILARNFDDVNLVNTFFITPLIYLGGVFYSISFLSGFWQSVSQFNPILYMVNGLRYGFLGVSDVNIYISFIMMICFIIFFFFLNLYLLKIGYKIKN